MNLTLNRKIKSKDGIFGDLLDDKGERLFVTLEHAYQDPVLLTYFPKIPAGEYNCIRGMHRLEDKDHPFETFEITGVKDHVNLLFHVGNYNQDSKGCILLGTVITLSTPQMICASDLAFSEFMNLQKGVNEFILNIKAS